MKAGRAEEGILGLIFADPSLIGPLAERLRPEDFTAPVLAKIYARALELDRQGAPIAVSGYEGYLDDGELALLSGILSRPPVLERRQQALDDYIKIMDERRAQRMLENPPAPGAEDPMITFSKMKADKMGGK